MSELPEILKDFRGRLEGVQKELGLNDRQFAKALEIEYTTYRTFMGRDPQRPGKAGPTFETIHKIGTHLPTPYDLHWLLTGQSSPRQADTPPEIVFSPVKLKGIEENPAMLRLADVGGNYAAVPLLRDAVAAGAPTEVAERDVENWAIIYKDRKWLPRGPENYTCVRVRGRSMFPVLNDGDIVAIDHSEKPTEIRELKRLNGKIVAFKIDGGVTIKWLKFDENTETVVGVPENKEELDHLVILRGKEINEGIVGLVRWWWSKR